MCFSKPNNWFSKKYLTFTTVIIKELEESITKLSKDLKVFEIANDYKDIEELSNKLSYDLKQKNNEIAIVEETLKNISKSLNLKTDVGIIDVQKMIAQVNIELGVDISQKLEDVIRFHNSLTTGREERLKKKNKDWRFIKTFYYLNIKPLLPN